MAKGSGRTLGGFLPIGVWLTAVAGVAFMYTQRVQSYSLVGLTYAPSQTLAAADNGTVLQIPVKMYQPVRKGDLLAVMELGSPVENDYQRALAEAQKATARAELEKLKAELASIEADLLHQMEQDKADRSELYRRLVVDVAQAKLELMEARSLLEPDTKLLAGLELEKNAVEELHRQGAIEAYEFETVRMEYEAQLSKVRAEEQVVAQAQENLTEAEGRLEGYSMPSEEQAYVDKMLSPYIRAVAVQEKLIGELFAPPGRLPLKAPIDGVVTAILCTEGQGVTAGQMLLTVCSPEAEYVTAWVDQNRSLSIQPNQPMRVIKQSTPRRILETEVAAVSPVVELLPEQLWGSPTTPRWGRAVQIRLPADSGLAGNEIVGVQGF